MKKVAIGVGILVLGGIVYLAIFGLPRLGSFLDGKKGAAVLGDMEIPVTAVGSVQPARLIQMKSKASGEVQKIHVVEGQLVKAGDTLIQLNPKDEERNVERSAASVDRAKAALEKAKSVLEKQKVDLPQFTKIAEARLEDAKARFSDAAYNYERLAKMSPGVVADREMKVVETAKQSADAAVRIAESEVVTAKSNEQLLLISAEQDVAQADAAYREALKQFDEAKQRLDETTIIAPADAMVYSILTREGEVIQGGQATFTGGTLLTVLADVSSMFVMAQVDEADIGAIREIAPEYARPGLTQKLTDEEYQQRGRQIIDVANQAASGNPGDKNESADAPSEAPPVPGEVREELLGRPVEVTVEAYRGESYRGVIERILPEPIQAGGAVSFNVRVRLYGEDVQKLMGLQADLSFRTKTQKGVVLVPNEALVSEDRRCFVWIPHRESPREREGKKKIPVTIGDTDGVNTVISAGLKPGDEVWVKLPRLLDQDKEKS